MKTIVILGDIKSKQYIDHLKRLLEGECTAISPFCFIGWQLTFKDEINAWQALDSAWHSLSRSNPQLYNTIHLQTGENFITYEGVRAEIVNSEEL